MIRTVSVVLLINLLICSDLFTQDLKSILPDSTAGWKKQDPSRIYTGDELFSLIDGGAEIYFEYGFKEVLAQTYSKDNKTIGVEIYNMTDSSSAFGIFSLQTIKTGESIKFAVDASSGEGFLLFWKGNYYITLSASSSDSPQENMKGLLALAEGIETRINAADKPVLAASLSEKFKTKVVYLHGYLSVYNLYIFAAENIFNVKEGYYFKQDNVMNFIFKYADNEAASKQFEASNKALALINKLQKKPSNGSGSYLFKEKNGNWINTRQSGKYIIVSVSDKAKIPGNIIPGLEITLNK